jgi:hypothetical protein
MTVRRTCPPAPGALEGYAAEFDPLLATLAQRRGFREYLTGLLHVRERNKTLTGLVGSEPILQAQHPAVQRLQFFLSESTWDAEEVNTRRLALLTGQAGTSPHAGGVLVIDDSGHRKAGHATAHVARQYLGSIGKIDNGIVVVSTLWADERVYYPLHTVPYTPRRTAAPGQARPGFRHQARTGRRPGGAGGPGRGSVRSGGYGQRLRSLRDRHPHRRAAYRWPALRAGTQAPHGHLGQGG